MAKKEMTWMDVIREQLNKMRKEGKHPSIGDVTPIAKKEWEDIKAGKHPLYIQGSSKGKKNKTHKLGKSKGNGKLGKGKGMKTRKSKDRVDTPMPSNKTAIEQMLSSVHLCKKDAAKVMKYVKSVKQSGGSCGCDKQSGGKGKGKGSGSGKRSSGKRRGRKMKGGAGAAGSDSAGAADSAEADSADSADADKEAFTDTLDKETGEYASDETEKDVVNEAVESP